MSKNNIKILLVEDNDADIRFIKELLKNSKTDTYKIIVCKYLKSALETIDGSFDVILLDLKLPDSTGMDTIKSIINVSNKAATIILTGTDNKSNALHSLKLGAQDYIVKDNLNRDLLKKSIDYSVERQKIESKLVKSERNYKLLIESMSEGIWQIDKNEITVFVNSKMAEMLGYEPEEMIGNHLFKFIDKKNIEECKLLLSKRKKSISENHTFEFVRKDKKNIFVRMEASPILDENNNYNGAIAYVTDITKQKMAENALEEREVQFNSFMKYLPACSYIKDCNGKYLFLNDYYKKLLNIDEKTNVEGKTDFDLWPEKIAEKFVKDDKKVCDENKKIEIIEETVNKEDGKEYIYLTTKFPIKKNKGKTIMGGISFDITKLKSAEKQLKQSEERYRKLFENSRDGIYKTTIDGHFIAVNKALVNMLGYNNKADLMSENFAKILYGPSNKNTVPFENGGPFETKLKKKDKTIIDVEISSNIIFKKDKPVANEGIIRNITQRKKSQKLVKESFARTKKTLDDLIKSLGSIIDIQDPYTAGHQKRVSILSEAICKELKLSEKEISNIKTAALIHDIGKITIPASILSKPGKLSNVELNMIKQHPEIGSNIIKRINFDYPVYEIILQHHERVNGSGYPNSLKKDEILLGAKIIAVADTVEAMSSHRPYRPSFGIKKALNEIEKNKGILYDEETSDICISLFKDKNFSFK